jgi:hypothetical protein
MGNHARAGKDTHYKVLRVPPHPRKKKKKWPTPPAAPRPWRPADLLTDGHALPTNPSNSKFRRAPTAEATEFGMQNRSEQLFGLARDVGAEGIITLPSGACDGGGSHALSPRRAPSLDNAPNETIPSNFN